MARDDKVHSVKLVLDAAPFESALAKAAHLSPEVTGRLLDLFDAGEELARVETDVGAATTAGELTVRLYPTDRFARLVATA